MNKKLVYINVALGVILAFLAFTYCKNCFFSQPNTLKENAVPATPAPQTVKPEPVIYSLEKDAPKVQASSSDDNVDMPAAYQKYPKDKMGGNIAEAWSMVRPEDKETFNKEIETRILAAKKEVEFDPTNKRAIHELFIAETMKKLAENNFVYDQQLHETVMKDKTGKINTTKK